MSRQPMHQQAPRLTPVEGGSKRQVRGAHANRGAGEMSLPRAALAGVWRAGV